MDTTYQNKKVLIMGLGLSGGGVGAAAFFASQGAQVTVTDLRDADVLKKSLQDLEQFPITYVFGRHQEHDFETADIVVVNPSVPRSSAFLTIAQNSGAVLETELSLFVKMCRGKIIAVTGTKGKSTTATLIYDILSHTDCHVVLGGNIGISLLNELQTITPETFVVLEVSSFQLEWLDIPEFDPVVSILTNVYEDHLDRYETFDDYALTKGLIFKNQSPNHYAVANYNNVICMQYLARKRPHNVFFSAGGLDLDQGIIIENGWIVSTLNNIRQQWVAVADLPLQGNHNIENVLAAISVAAILNVSRESVREALTHSRVIEHRMEHVGSIEGITFINDSAATIPAATICALRSYSQPIHLIMGGVNKTSQFEYLALEIIARVTSLHLIGAAKDEIRQAIESQSLGEDTNLPPIYEHDSLKSAVRHAYECATPGSVVLLSPACASFDMFANSKERGKQFKEVVQELQAAYVV